MKTSKPNSQVAASAGCYANDKGRWEAVKARDEGAVGQFWFSVATTGVYCYPSCAARRPRREHVAFYDSREAAEQAGFRPCKRCRPDLPPRRVRHAEAVAQTCRIIEAAEKEPTLEELAAAVGLSLHYFHRRFKEIAGVTPKQYAAAHRAQRVQQELRDGDSVTEAIYGAGYSSSSRFYEKSRALLGMNPSTYAGGGRGEIIRWEVAESWLGSVLVGATARGICAILFGEDRDALTADLATRFPHATLEEADIDSDFSHWVARTIAFIDAPECGLDLPLDVAGTAFQQRVWAALRAVPAGVTTTYGEVARSIGEPRAARAVARACAANPVAVAIPCHRVLSSDGSLSGYRWGTERKQALLDKEASANDTETCDNAMDTMEDRRDSREQEDFGYRERFRPRQRDEAAERHYAEYREMVQSRYRPRHPELRRLAGWTFVDSFEQAVLKDGRPEALRAILHQASPDVYMFDMITPVCATKLLEEVAHFERWCETNAVAVYRPNSMNNYGVVLDDFGFAVVLDELIRTRVQPLAQLLFPRFAAGRLDHHHGFVVEYEIQGDLELDFHADDSEVTLNLCLGKRFTDGNLFFGGVRCAHHLQSGVLPDEAVEVEHRVGHGLLHLGAHRHLARPITGGARSNLILWCRSSAFRQALRYGECPDWCGMYRQAKRLMHEGAHSWTDRSRSV